MDENTAWQNFVQTGRVSDYLNYCRVKLGYPVQDVHKEPEVKNEDEVGGSYTQGPDRWR